MRFEASIEEVLDERIVSSFEASLEILVVYLFAELRIEIDCRRSAFFQGSVQVLMKVIDDKREKLLSVVLAPARVLSFSE